MSDKIILKVKRFAIEGVKMAVTIKDVAKYTGLSIATISKYINGGNVREQNRILIEDAIEKLGFKVNAIARGLKTNKTMTIGILIPSLENIFCTSIISNIENILIQNGYSTIICDYREDSKMETEKLDFLIDKKVDGIIYMPYSITAEKLNNITGKEIPIVLVDRPVEEANCDTVLVDNLNASYDAVEQLIIQGHKRIGIICGPKDIYTAKERLKGYFKVHEDYNIQVDSSLIKYGNYKVESGYKMLIDLINLNNPPTAVFVTNYEMTLGAVMAINEKNIKIPEELSFIGFDNLQMAKIVKPSLSIVVQPMQLIAETAANMILERLKGNGKETTVIHKLKTELIQGNSVCRVKA